MTGIFLNYDAVGLERQYMPGFWPNVSVNDTLDQWVSMGEAYHERANVKTAVPYGDTDRQRLDLFLPNETDAPILVFIHGGYWRNKVLNRSSYSYCAEPIVRAGAMVVMVDYDLCPDVSMDTLVQQVQRACIWVWRHAREHGGDPTRLHISGHSAGGQLAAMMATINWPSFEEDLPADMIKSIVPISGLFELEPLRLTSLNKDLHLDDKAVTRNSPRFLRPISRMPISVLVGGAESNEFRRQSRDFADAWRGSASQMDFIETPDDNHFTIIEAMTEPNNLLAATILRHLEL